MPWPSSRDDELFGYVADERVRQNTTLQLIASENFASPAVLEASGSVLTNKYAEGYPGKRYYGGNVHVDEVEDLARERVKALFGADHANVQPHSGANANMAVYQALLSPGDTVLVHGGTSGIGTMAISLCRLFDVTIIVTCGSDEKCAQALDWGASHAVNYKSQDFVAEVKRITDGKGCQAVLDMVGGDYVPRNLECLAEDGRHVSIAVLGGAKAEIFIPMIMQRRLTLTASTLRARSVGFKSLVADELARTVWPFAAEGRLRPAMDQRFDMTDAAKAHARMDAGEHFGKIVLTM